MTGACSSRLALSAWLSGAAALLGLSFGLALATGPAAADKVGVAAAVNPDAFSSLAGSPQSQLNIGKSIFYNERINTTGSGLVQVLLVDGSTFTVGPGSDLIIDKFVYDPKKGVGKISASFSKGVMRFVGGKISKNEDAVSIKTSAGALAVRGGMYLSKIWGNNAIFAFLYGENLTLTTPNGKQLVVFQPGNGIFVLSGKAIIRPFTAEDIKDILAALSNVNKGGGTTSPGNNPADAGSSFFQTNNASTDPDDIINSFTQAQLFDAFGKGPNNQQSPVNTSSNNPPPSSGLPPSSTPVDPTNTTVDPTDTTGDPTDTTGDPTDTTGDPTDTTGDPTDTIPGARPGEIGTYAAGLREGSGQTAPTTLKNVVFDAGSNRLSFRLDGEDSDLISIVFNSDGKPTVTVTPPDKEAKVNSVSQTALATKQQESYASWGSWQTHIEYKYEDSDKKKKKSDDSINLFASGWWVAGELTTVGDIDKLAALGAEATYNGTVGGTVASNLGEGNWKTYDATGSLTMNWSFGARKGDLTISNFDQRSYKADDLAQPSMDINQFSGSLKQIGGDPIGLTSGGVTGSFVNNGSVAAGGVIGNWNVDSANYKATGIFAGAGTPGIPATH